MRLNEEEYKTTNNITQICESVILTSSSHELFIIAFLNMNFNASWIQHSYLSA